MAEERADVTYAKEKAKSLFQKAKSNVQEKLRQRAELRKAYKDAYHEERVVANREEAQKRARADAARSAMPRTQRFNQAVQSFVNTTQKVYASDRRARPLRQRQSLDNMLLGTGKPASAYDVLGYNRPQRSAPRKKPRYEYVRVRRR